MSEKREKIKKQVQSLLKGAKKELVDKDYDGCIETCKSILKLDKTNFFCYLFLGKSFEAKKRPGDALKAYQKATEIEPDQALGWKGQLSIKVEDPDFKSFFETVLLFTKLLISKKDPLTEAVNYIKDYVGKHGLDFQPLKVYYLRQITPGLSELGDLIGYQIENPSTSIEALIKLYNNENSTEIKKIKDSVKLSFSINMTESAKNEKYNEKIWPLLSESELPKLYELWIDLEQIDEKRYKIQNEYLEFKYNLLFIAPVVEKPRLRAEIKDLVEGMVLIKCPSELAWKIHFDWLDPQSLAGLDIVQVVDYINLFGKKRGFGAILYLYLISDISPFEKSKVAEYLAPGKEKAKGKTQVSKLETEHPGQLLEDVPKTGANNQSYDIFDVTPQEIFTKMLSNLSQVKSSVLCCRIVLNYAIHLKDYAYALDVSTDFTNALVLLQNSRGIVLSNSKMEQTLALAIIYTYYEAPKNFPKALSLYDSIWRKDPNNTKVKIGKALILVETKKYDEAAEIFKSLITSDPTDVDATQEYGWCQIQLGNFELGREYIERAISTLQSEAYSKKSLNFMEVVSTLKYRLAMSYYMQFDGTSASLHNEATLKEYIGKCSKLLIECLKISPNHAPSFTALGLLHYNYLGKKERAIKLFYKAFELDPSQIEASYKLAEHFTSIGDWEMADLICKSVTENSKAKRQLSSSYSNIKDKAWPYRVLGCASMEFKEDVKAIEYFQSALRMDSSDISSWIGLGEAYMSRGRLEASVKVFTHVIKLQSGVLEKDVEITPEMEKKADWHVVYLLAVALTNMLEFENSIRILTNLLDTNEEQRNNSCILTLLIETLILRCDAEIERGAILRASDTLLSTFSYLFHAFDLENKSTKLWKALGDLLRIALTVRSSISRVPFSKVHNLVSNFMTEKDEMWELVNFEEFQIDDLMKKEKFPEVCHIYYSLSCIGGYLCTKEGAVKTLRSSLLFNIAISFISWYRDSLRERYVDTSIRLLNKCVKLEPENSEYWNCLGIVSMGKNPKVSQHCYIKAISIESKSPIYWFNLGMLYIKYGDYELAKNCFTRAQSIGATNCVPWAGHALICKKAGDIENARNLFTHSYVLSRGTNPSMTILYAISVLEEIVSEGDDERNLEAVEKLTSVNYGMINYLKLFPSDTFALELTVKIIERLYSFNSGIEYSKNLCQLYEQEYEETESERILINYCMAKCQYSRFLLAKQEYVKASEVCDDVGSLLDTISDITMQVQRCMLSCFTVFGLSLYFQGDYERSLEEFRKLVDAFPENERIVVLISQVLFASGDEAAKQEAMDELLNNIATQGTSLIVAMTIAAISLVEDLTEYIDAVKEVLDQLPLDTLIRDSHREIPKLLIMISKRITAKQPGTRVNRTWQRNAVLFPGDISVWSHVDSEVALELSIHTKKDCAMDVSDAYAKVKRLREAQRSILLSGGVNEKALAELFSLVGKA